MGFVELLKKRAKESVKTIVLPETEDMRTLEATDKILKEGVAKIILIGNEEEINKKAAEGGFDISGATIVDPETSDRTQAYIDKFVELRAKKGMTPEKAKEILEAAGCEMGDDGFYYRDGEKVGFVISVSAGDQVRIDMAQIAAQELKEIGMDVSVEIPAQTDWAGQMAFLIGWGSPFDADDHTYKVFGTDKGANYSSYSNADVDKYLTEARQSDDPKVRAEAYANFQKALAEDPAYAMICYIDANYVADSNIKGIDPDTIMGHHGDGIFWNVADWTIE